MGAWVPQHKAEGQKAPKPQNPTVDDINPALITLSTLNYGKYGLFLIMGYAGFISSTLSARSS